MSRLLVDNPPFLLDTFTDTNGTAISSHTPNTVVSGGWSQTAGTSFYIQSNTLQANRYTDGDLATIEVGASDFNLRCTVLPFNNAGAIGYAGVVFRYVDSSNFWYMFPDSFNGFIKVYSVVSGSHTQRIFLKFTGVSGYPVELGVNCKGQNITLFVNGMEQVTYTSSINQTATKVGVRCGKVGSPATSPSWDSFSVQTFNGTVINWPLFTEYASGPIVTLGSGGAWDNTDINNPNVFYDSGNSRWVCTYSGYKTATGNVQALGLAYASTILGSWTKEATNPVFTGGGSYGQNGGIVKKGSTYYYYYGSGGATTISLATSTDYLTWVDQGVVLSATAGKWDSGGVFDAFARLREDGNTIEIWYAASDGGGRRIGYATSTDGTTITKFQGSPIIGPQSWAGSLATYGEPCVYVPTGKEGKEMMISFDSADGSSPNTRFISQAVTIDGGLSWHWRTSALEAQSYAWENHQVFDSFIMVSNNVMYLFHSGSDQFGAALDLNIQIGVASATYPYTTFIGG